MKSILILLGVATLLLCIYSASQFFLQRWDESTYKNVFLGASAAWFAIALGIQRLSKRTRQ